MNNEFNVEAETLVLLSGGIDSTACIHFYSQTDRPVEALFINYGQAARISEEKAAIRVAEHYGIHLNTISLAGGYPKADGFIPARNLLLISIALMEKQLSISAIALGIHAGTNYPDCSEGFISDAQAITRFCQPELVTILAPFVTWDKNLIINYCKEEKVPIQLTYSCESSDEPCGICLSCKDREFLHASS